MPVMTRRALRSNMQVVQVDDHSDVEGGRLRRWGRVRRVNEESEEDEDEDGDADADRENSNVDVDIEGDGDEEGDEDLDVDVDVIDSSSEDEIPSSTDIPSSHDLPNPKSGVSVGGLKIRLKLPRYETPILESEVDSMSVDSEQPRAMGSGKRKRPLTSRQAVLANVMDPRHVSLGLSGKGKGEKGDGKEKKQLNETELALRREETARKRRNLTEKKLEDEKLETINRLLRKQSRPRKKRHTAQSLDDIVPSPSTPPIYSSTSLSKSKRPPRKSGLSGGADAEEYDDEGEGEGEDDEQDDDALEEGVQPDPAPPPELHIPTMYRWVSRSMGEITFSVPTCALPQCEEMTLPPTPRPQPRPTTCAAPGCGKPFRYRLVGDWTRGACGIECLRRLQVEGGALNSSPA